MRPSPAVPTSGGGTRPRQALRVIFGMASALSLGEASEAGLVAAATFLAVLPLFVLFGVDRASGAVFGVVLSREDVRAGGLLIGGSTGGASMTGGVADFLGSASVGGVVGGVVTAYAGSWGGVVTGTSLMGARCPDSAFGGCESTIYL